MFCLRICFVLDDNLLSVSRFVIIMVLNINFELFVNIWEVKLVHEICSLATLLRITPT